MGDVISREEVNRSLGRGVVGVGTGISLLVLNSLPAWSILGFAPIPLGIGAILALAGWNNLKKHEGSLGGLLALGAGVLTAASGLPLLGGLAGFALGAGALGGLIYGGLQFFRFWKGLKSRT